MRRDILPELHEPWMRKLHIAPLALDADLLDLSQKFRTRLYESLLTHGWDQSQSMVLASSDDPRLDNQIVQARHRVVIISQILKDGHRFDISKILIRREPVDTIDQLRALRAAYEVSAAMTKDPKMSKKWVEANLRPLIRGKVQEGQTKIIAYLHDLGFQNDSVAVTLIEQELDAIEKKRQKKQKDSRLHVPEAVKNQEWYSGPKPETLDNATSYIRKLVYNCQHCGKENQQHINIACSDKGELVKVAVAS